MGILGDAQVSTSDQDLSGQRRRLEAAGAARIFEDVISGRSLSDPVLPRCLTMPARATACAWCAWTASADRCAS
jgi:DNA invertase Pin-like site-specific DNA recombinase